METLRLHLFTNSVDPFCALLNEYNITYQIRAPRKGIALAGAETLEILNALGDIAFWPSLASVIVAFVKARYGRKVIVTTKDNAVVHLEGMTSKEIEKFLEQSDNITIFDPTKKTEPN